MAESTPNADATSDAGAMPAGVAEAVTDPNADAGIGDAGKRALAELRRELKETRAERDTLASAQRERDDAERTELEKLTSARDELSSKSSALEMQVLKMQAAIEAGIPDQWMRLNGATADELKTDAKAFANSLGRTTDDTPATSPADLGAGSRPGVPATGSAGFSATLRDRARTRR